MTLFLSESCTILNSFKLLVEWYTFWSDTLKKCVNLVNKKFVERKWPHVGHFAFDQVLFVHGISLRETAHFVL